MDFREIQFSHDERIIRGTTPDQDFYFDIDPREVFKEIQITYMQNDKTIVQKNKSDLEFLESTDDDGEPIYLASFAFTQEETKLFSAKNSKYVYLQVRALTYGGEAIAFEKTKLRLEDVLDDEVLE